MASGGILQNSKTDSKGKITQNYMRFRYYSDLTADTKLRKGEIFRFIGNCSVSALKF